jgi:hypothetical protein
MMSQAHIFANTSNQFIDSIKEKIVPLYSIKHKHRIIGTYKHLYAENYNINWNINCNDNTLIPEYSILNNIEVRGKPKGSSILDAFAPISRIYYEYKFPEDPKNHEDDKTHSMSLKQMNKAFDNINLESIRVIQPDNMDPNKGGVREFKMIDKEIIEKVSKK